MPYICITIGNASANLFGFTSAVNQNSTFLTSLALPFWGSFDFPTWTSGMGLLTSFLVPRGSYKTHLDHVIALLKTLLGITFLLP